MQLEKTAAATTKPSTPTMTTTAPSTFGRRGQRAAAQSLRSSAYDVSAGLGGDEDVRLDVLVDTSAAAAAAVPSVRPDEPNLYDLPKDLHPTYRPLPIIVTMANVLISAAIAALTTWHLGIWQDLRLLFWRRDCWKKIFLFAVKTFFFSLTAELLLQDIFLPPSRISTHALIRKYFLPSTLSKYEVLSIPRITKAFSVHHDHHNEPDADDDDNLDGVGDDTIDLGVHYLEYQPLPEATKKASRWDAIYVNHGFGASSLSWLPTLPRMVERLQGRIGLGHDATGFGFTDRTERLLDYTSAASAQTGVALLQNKTGINVKKRGANNNNKSILLMGHSMGSLATLRMALDLKQTNVRVILIAPALRFYKEPSNNATSSVIPPKCETATRKLKRYLSRIPHLLPLELPAVYMLRRLVGRPTFWRKGLELAWGDKKRLSDSDVLRFQWPAIGKGWEQGLLHFSQATLVPPAVTDKELLQQVLDRGIPVDVIIGTKDLVVRTAWVRKFLESFPTVRLTEMEGLGHDPFEEDVDSFINLVEQLLDQPFQGGGEQVLQA